MVIGGRGRGHSRSKGHKMTKYANYYLRDPTCNTLVEAPIVGVLQVKTSLLDCWQLPLITDFIVHNYRLGSMILIMDNASA